MNIKNSTNDRHFYNSYRRCYCSKHQTIQLGWKLYGYASMFVAYPLITLVTLGVLIKFQHQDFSVIFLVLVVASLASFNLISGYRELYKIMIAAGHTVKCSKKISRRGSFYNGTYSEFKILSEETK